MLISPFLEIILSIALDHQACYILLWLFHWPGKPSCQLLENSSHRLHLPLLLALCSQTYSCSEKTFPRDPSLAVFPFCTSPRLCRLVHQPQTPCPQGCSADLPAIGLLRVLRKKKKKNRTEWNQLPTFKDQETLRNIWFLASLKELDDWTIPAPFLPSSNLLEQRGSCPFKWNIFSNPMALNSNQPYLFISWLVQKINEFDQYLLYRKFRLFSPKSITFKINIIRMENTCTPNKEF